jgi:hypothetical protein
MYIYYFYTNFVATITEIENLLQKKDLLKIDFEGHDYNIKLFI